MNLIKGLSNQFSGKIEVINSDGVKIIIISPDSAEV